MILEIFAWIFGICMVAWVYITLEAAVQAYRMDTLWDKSRRGQEIQDQINAAKAQAKDAS